ncbi:MAG TPA: DUF4198 domain-containing protein [Candidatus Eisenbacteria bacterium]
MIRRIAFPIALLAASTASAHEFWLSPSTYRAGARDTVAVSTWAGTGFRGEAKPWAAPRAVRFTLRTTREFDLRPAATNGDLTWARLVLPDQGGAMIGFESNFADIELEAAEFDRYLTLEGLDGPLRARQTLGSREGAGRERYGRCPKTWIAGADAKRATAPLGLPLELVPLADPTRASPLRLRLLDHGKPLAGALVRAWHRPLEGTGRPADPATRDSVGMALEARTDAGGMVTLDTSRPGEWLVSAVHMIPSGDRAEADWESRWASLTFARAGR